MTTHVIGLSGGKDSTALALRLSEIAPEDYIYMCTPTGDELPEMEKHWQNLECIKLLLATHLEVQGGTHGLHHWKCYGLNLNADEYREAMIRKKICLGSLPISAELAVYNVLLTIEFTGTRIN